MERKQNAVAPDQSTEVTSRIESGETERDDSPGASLVVAWSAASIDRIGEVLKVPSLRGARFWFGRGNPRPEEDDTRAEFYRQRPGEDVRTESPMGPRISRRQLSLRAAADGSIEVENIGRCAMLIDGAPATAGTVRPGGTIELKDQLLLYLARRPARLPRAAGAPTEGAQAFGRPDADGFVGESPVAWALRHQIARLAGSPGHVLILGESGAGKELAAQAIHRLSPRAARPIVSRSAATFPAGLIDAELFGNARDYPQAGMPARPGLVGAADGSTLFLDEIGEFPVDMQAHLLRVLDGRGEYQRLGESQTRTSDLRLVAATNRPPAEIKPDLAARLPLRLSMPGLNQRREDIPLLIRHLLTRAASDDATVASRFFDAGAAGTPSPRIALGLVRALVLHEYRLHVRELHALLWTSIGSSRGDHLDLTDEVVAALGTPDPEEDAERPGDRSPSPSPEVIQECLDRHAGVQEKVWRELGLRNRYVLKRLIKKHGLRTPPDPPA